MAAGFERSLLLVSCVWHLTRRLSSLHCNWEYLFNSVDAPPLNSNRKEGALGWTLRGVVGKIACKLRPLQAHYINCVTFGAICNHCVTAIEYVIDDLSLCEVNSFPRIPRSGLNCIMWVGWPVNKCYKQGLFANFHINCFAVVLNLAEKPIFMDIRKKVTIISDEENCHWKYAPCKHVMTALKPCQSPSAEIENLCGLLTFECRF
jgi:hypothetical protein